MCHGRPPAVFLGRSKGATVFFFNARAFIRRIRVQCEKAGGRVTGLFTGLLSEKNVMPKSNNTELRGTQRRIDPPVHRPCAKGEGGGKIV